MSITDHDTIDAYFELQPKDIPKGLLYIPGTELSVNSDVDGKRHHMLAFFPKLASADSVVINKKKYYIDRNQSTLQQFSEYRTQLNEMRKFRILRAQKYFEKLNELYNLSLNFDEFCKINKINMENYTSENVVGRPMIAQYMIKQKICDSVQQCFQSYLSDESPAFQKLPRQSMENTITKLN